jgi:hypothetical protein
LEINSKIQKQLRLQGIQDLRLYFQIRKGNELILKDEEISPGVRMSLYLISCSRLNTINASRELSKCMDGAIIGDYLEILRVTKIGLDTKILCLKMKPQFKSEYVT